MFTPEQLSEVRVPGGVRVLGDHLVYALRWRANERKASSLWALPLSDGPPVRWTFGPFADRSPVPMPDGRLLFVSDRTGHDQVWIREGGGIRPLTAFADGNLGVPCVSPKGRIAVVFAPGPPADDDLPLAADRAAPGIPTGYPGADPDAGAVTVDHKAPRARVITRLMNRDDGGGFRGARPAVFEVHPGTGEARRRTDLPADVRDLVWDGDDLLLTASYDDFDPTRGSLLRVGPGGEVEVVTSPPGVPMAPSVSPDRRIAVLVHPPDDDEGAENTQVWLLEPLVQLDPHLDRPAVDVVIDDLSGFLGGTVPPIWRDGGVVVVVSDEGSVRLRWMPLDGGPGRWLTPPGGSLAEPVAIPGGFAGVWAAADRLPEVGWFVDAPQVRTHHNRGLGLVARRPAEVRLPSGAVGYYLAPRGSAAKAPGILYIHGGPAVAYGERLFFEMQVWADRGYAVLFPNPRGGQSFGAAFAGAIRRPRPATGSRACSGHTPAWGTADAEDLEAFARWLGARPEVDPARLVVAGGSYGGFMSLHLAGTTDLFACAIMERGLYDWSSSVGSSDFGHTQPRLFGGTWPWEDPTGWGAASAIRHVGGVRCPTLIIHYEGDLRCGVEQAHRLHAALSFAGVPTALLLFPEEGHGMSRGGRIDRRLERYRQIGAWMERFVGPTAQGST